jgi:alanyl-tRNA synthetase
MSTVKLYYQDVYQKVSRTKITSEKEDERGWWYTFAETIFYPEGGGQDADSGWINHKRILDVQSQGGEIWHLLPERIVSPAEMQLDWARRYENMQQHTGQHILSACFKERHNLDTVAVHLGHEITMIELQASTLDETILRDTEWAANEIIRSGQAVKSAWITHDKLDPKNLRRPIKTADDDIRLIHIGEIDCVGCGGTHVRSTAEVGLIKIVGTEKIRNHIRVQIKIGQSAYQYYDQLHHVLQRISNRLTTSISDLPDRIETLILDNKELGRKLNKVSDLWMMAFAETLPEGKYDGCYLLKDLSAGQLKTLSEHWLKKFNRPCFFISQERQRTYFFLRVPDQSRLNLQEFLRKNRSKFSLKGGGNEKFANGQIDRSGLGEDQIDLMFKIFTEFQKVTERE